jgi:uncharacterized membrane protein YfcA
MLEELGLYLLGGAVAGVLAGLFGVGGGTILVPALLIIFSGTDIPEALWMHLALGTSLAVIVLNAISSVRSHHRRGGVNWPVLWNLTPGVILGASVGAWIADGLESRTLALLFAAFLLLIGLQMLAARQPKPHRVLPGRLGLVIAGGVIGVVSALVGIGGGSLTVPFLAFCNVAIARAVGTSAAVGLPIALAGTLGYLITGLDAVDLPSGAIGYVYLPAFLGMAVAGMACAPLGARIAHALPAAQLKRAFGIFLLLVSARMFYTLV